MGLKTSAREPSEKRQLAARNANLAKRARAVRRSCEGSAAWGTLLTAERQREIQDMPAGRLQEPAQIHGSHGDRGDEKPVQI